MLLIKDLTFTAWGRRFFDGATVSIPDGHKVGLVGRNGIGKTTLFRLILGEFEPTGGSITLPSSGRVATVDQEAAASPINLLDTVLAAHVERAALLDELETAPPERLGEIHARLIDIGAAAAPAKASEILRGLSFSADDLSRPMSEFSGGWRMRVALAAALFAEPDLLLLDEPTNYLDLEGALWLEARLKKYPRTCIIISHDRELLNGSVEAILHVSQGQLDLYTGGYDDFERLRAEKLRLQESERTKQEAERAHLQAFVDRFRAKASKAAQAQSRMKRLAKLQPITSGGIERTAPFTLPSPARQLSPPLIAMEGASVGYGDSPVIRNLTLRLDVDDRIGLLGINGAGKSTFAKLLAGALKNMHGEVQRDSKMKVGWFHQHQLEALDPDETPLDLIRRALPDTPEATRRSRLAQFGLGADKAETKHSGLSGGERARLLLHLVAMEGPHLLILDEPTNHLDIDSRRALMEALNDYEGAVLLITHDRSLMELVADRLWLVDAGTVKPFGGDMDEYAKLVLDRARISARSSTSVSGEAPASQKNARKAAADARARVAPLKRAVDKVEAKMAALATQIAEIDKKLADPKLFSSDPMKATFLGKDRADAHRAMAVAEAEWLEAADAYETAKAAAGI